MSTQRVSATLDDEVVEEIRRTVGARGFSRFLSEAARDRLQRMRILALVPAVTLAEATTGRPGPDAPTNRLIRQIGNTIPCDEKLGRAAGVLRTAALARRSGASGIDAIVAAVGAANGPSIVRPRTPAT